MEEINARLRSWASVLDEKMRAQAEATSTMPFIHPHLALMPDAHLGLGDRRLGDPDAAGADARRVGVDIGCGMIAVRTPLHADDLAGRSLAPLREAVEAAVPL